MEKIDIENILNLEINNLMVSTDKFYLDKIKPYLISPEKKAFINPVLDEEEVHWVVFDENKNDKEFGYLIFYSESDEAFGIGTKMNLKRIPNIGTFVGIYGSLSDAVNSM